MGRITGKKQKLNYRPIIWVAAVALPLAFVLAFFMTPSPPADLAFERPPTYSPHLTAQGALQIRWQTNVPSRGTVYFRSRDDVRYQQTVTSHACDHVASIPARAGEEVEFYVQAARGRDELKSDTFTVVVQPPSATGPADGEKS